MKKAHLILVTAAALLGSPAHAGQDGFRLSSPDLIEGGQLTQVQVLNGFGCSGENRSPALAWSDPPAGTKAFALTAYDPDAPTGSGWWHWVVFNLPADLRALPEGAGDPAGALLPAGAVQSRTDFGGPGYGGACPPPGDPAHRYVFTVWALDTEHLPLDSEASGAMVGFLLHQHALRKAALTARRGR